MDLGLKRGHAWPSFLAPWPCLAVWDGATECDRGWLVVPRNVDIEFDIVHMIHMWSI